MSASLSSPTLGADLKLLAETGLAHQSAGRYAEAAQAYVALLSREPQLWQACYNLALTYQHLRRMPEAAEMYARAVRLNPNFAEGFNNLGNVLKALKNNNAAIEAYQHALALKPQLSEASYNIAMILQARGDLAAAIESFRQSVENNPAHGDAWDALYRGLLGLHRQEDAIQAFFDWERLAPLSPEMVIAGLALCRPMGDRDREARYLSLALTWPFAIFTPQQFAPVLGMIQYFDVSRKALMDCYRRYDEAVSALQPVLIPLLSARAADSRLRIGYVSGDFRHHVMGRMMLDVIARHDRNRFSIMLISTCLRSQHDAITAAFRQHADGFADISELDDFAAAKSIAEADIDVLVDLAGHTDTARPPIYAHRPARSIVTHLGYHGCLGLKAIDFKLTDHIADLPNAAAYQIEPPFALEGCVFPLVRILPSAEDPPWQIDIDLAGKFVFGAFLNVLKLSPRCLTLWRRILDALPEAVLLFSPLDASGRLAIERVMATAGIHPSHIAVLSVTQRDDPSLRARYRLVNAVLDTFPYAGGDTTLAALDMGVPVVTLIGERHSERIGASILGHMGLHDLVANGEEEYVAIATRLARDPKFMADTRQTIVTAVAGVAAGGDIYTRSLENALVEIAVRRPVVATMEITARHFFQTLHDAMRRQRVATNDQERRVIAEIFANLRTHQADYPPLLRAQSEIAQTLNDPALAADCLAVLLRQFPDDLDIRLSLAGFLIAQNAGLEALKIIDEVQAQAGSSVRILKLQTRAHSQLHQWTAARESSAMAVEKAPADADALFWHGTVLSHLGEFETALIFLNRALILAPDHAEAAFNAGVILMELGNHADAEKVFRRALGTSAARMAHSRLLLTLRAAGRHPDWLIEAQRFVDTYPGLEYARLLESQIARFHGDIEGEARILLPLAERALMIEDDVAAAELLGELLAILPYRDVSPRLIQHLHARFTATQASLYPPLVTTLSDGSKSDNQLLKFGYVVDFSLPFVSELIVGLATYRDRDRQVMSIYVMSPTDPVIRAQLEATGANVVVLTGFDDHRAAEKILGDHLDVLLDASGFGIYAKPGLLSHRPAPVQIALPGFTQPAAIGDFDFRLSDPEIELALDTEALTPGPCLLEGCAFPLLPLSPTDTSANTPITRASLNIDDEVRVFGVLAPVSHLSPRCVGLWRSLAVQLPEAVFYLCPPHFADIAPMRKILTVAGIEAARIFSLPVSLGVFREGLLAGVVDIILDTMPGSDYGSVRASVLKGIPMVTISGRMPGERIAFSQLSYIGETSTVAASGRDYADIAVRLATNREACRTWSARVARLRQAATPDPRFSMQSYTRRFEVAVVGAVARKAATRVAAITRS